jgi:hypothetical protein
MSRVILGRLGDASFGIDTVAADYPAWQPDVEVIVGERYSHEGMDYEVIQSHVTQTGWEPPSVPALFKVHRKPFDPWVQPAGSHDAYSAIDDDGAPTTATHNGQGWVNTHGDGNVWVPGEFGWSPTDIPESVLTLWAEGLSNPVQLSISAGDYEQEVTIDPNQFEVRLVGRWDQMPNTEQWTVGARWAT